MEMLEVMTYEEPTLKKKSTLTRVNKWCIRDMRRWQWKARSDVYKFCEGRRRRFCRVG